MKKCLPLFLAVVFISKVHAQADTLVSSFVSIASFQAQPVENVILLKWSVVQTEEYKSFDIERSDDGVNFIKIGSKLAISKSNIADYDFVDATPQRNMVLRYRLKLISKDGFVTYSGLKETRLTDVEFVVRLKQNPVRNSIEAELSATKAKQVSVIVVSQTGQQLSSQTVKLSTGINRLSVSAQSLLPGLYQLVMESGNERKIISFIKE